MCTVTIIPRKDSARVTCNRDEQRARPAALLPQIRHFGMRHAIMPIDPVSDGTWVAAGDSGLVFCLLNVYSTSLLSREAGEGKPLLSRGLIIPSLLHCDSMQDALRESCNLRTGEYAPFRLVITDGRDVAELSTADGPMLVTRRWRLRSPLLFTSSGLGDHLVQGPRRALFDSLFASVDNWEAAQYQFHQHHWPDRPHLSVHMSRADACTVSRTVIDLRRDGIDVEHHPCEPAGPVSTLSLNLVSAGVLAT